MYLIHLCTCILHVLVYTYVLVYIEGSVHTPHSAQPFPLKYEILLVYAGLRKCEGGRDSRESENIYKGAYQRILQ